MGTESLRLGAFVLLERFLVQETKWKQVCQLSGSSRDGALYSNIARSFEGIDKTLREAWGVETTLIGVRHV